MKNRIVSFLLVISLTILLCSCGNTGSSFSIRFIDVGQGDAALIECDGHHMLIDGGDKSHGKNVYTALEQEQIRRLDILVISHFHEDHYAGIPEAIRNITKIDYVLSNEDTYLNGKGDGENVLFEDSKAEEDAFSDFNHAISMTGIKKITIPRNGAKYILGSAVVEVVDVASGKNNDSLVVLVTYGKTRFLFTGDIQYSGQKRIVEKYAKGGDTKFKIDVLKMPHHGSWGPINANDNDLNRLINTLEPDYVVISVGAGNGYGHPHKETLDLLKQAGVKVYRTDQNGDIIVSSDGKEVSIQTTR